MSKATRASRWLSTAALALACASCGPEGNGPAPQGSGGPTTSPTPPPVIPVVSLPGSATFGTLGQTTSQTFVTLGYSFRANAGPMDNIPVAGTEKAVEGIRMRLVAPTSLLLAIDTIGEGTLVANGGSGHSVVNGVIEISSLSYNVLGQGASLSRIGGSGEAEWAKYAMFGNWGRIVTGPNPLEDYLFLYGLPTAAGAVPASGSARYRELPTNPVGPELVIDFAANTVSGTLTLGTGAQARDFTLRDVKLSADRTAFSGQLQSAASGQTGTVTGYLLGPAADELILRYELPAGEAPPEYLTVGLRVAKRV